MSEGQPKPVPPAGRLGLAQAVGLILTPSSPEGVQTYYATLLGRPPTSVERIDALEALHRGEAMRLDLLAGIVGSPDYRRDGAGGPGVWLIRFSHLAARLGGVGREARARRAAVSTAVAAAPPAAPGVDVMALTRRLVMLEGANARLETRLHALERRLPDADAAARTEARLAVVEEELGRRLDAPQG